MGAGSANDAELVARCRQGDAAAWSELVELFSGYVYAIAARGFRLGEHDAEDVFQEVFARLFEKLETHQTYLGTFIGRNTKFPQRWHFKEVGSLMLSIAEGCDGGKLSDDTAMHSSVYFNTAQLLLDGFRYYTYDLPVWIREGFGHYWGRRASPKWNSFDQQEGGVADMKSTWKWEPYVRNLVITRDKIAPFSEVIQWRNFGDIQFNDHTAIWSRMDWLMSQGAEKWHKFVFAVKGRVDANWFPDQTDLVGATREALKDAYGLSVLNFDDRWVEWVKENYPSK